MHASLDPTQALQPFMRLAQANMELLTRYWWSPDVAGETLRTLQGVFEQGQASFARVAGSQAFLGLMQGLMQNYTQFLADLSQGAYAAMAQAPAALMQQAEDAAGNVFQMATRGTRARHVG